MSLIFRILLYARKCSLQILTIVLFVTLTVLAHMSLVIRKPAFCIQGQLLEGVECHIYLYCFTFDDINLNRAFVIIVLFPKKYSNKKVCANGI